MKSFYHKIALYVENHATLLIVLFLSFLSITSFLFYYTNGLGLLYNDAKSHLDIGRRVVEGLTPGFIQLGSVWLPLPHLLMLPTIWNDFMWHSGLAGALPSMVSFVGVGLLIYFFLQKLGVNLLGRIAGVLAFSLNVNILYLQSTALTELLLLVTMLGGCYELLLWHKDGRLIHVIKAAFWIMLSTLVRYDGWFLFIFALFFILVQALRTHGRKTIETYIIPFFFLGGLGIVLWLAWNQAIFKDFFYFALGPYSAHEQQLAYEQTGQLVTKHNLGLSLLAYAQAVVQNSGWVVAYLAGLGMFLFWFDKHIKPSLRIAAILLFVPLFFNVVALYFGFSALFVPGVTGDVWFNARYGAMLVPTIAIFFGYFIDRLKHFGYLFLLIMVLFSVFNVVTQNSVVIQDGKFGGSGTNVREISSWLNHAVKDSQANILISTASHDQVVFSSGLPMKRFVHQGTGFYWDLAIAHPQRYVKWIVMRTGDMSDTVYRLVKDNKSFQDYYYRAGSFDSIDVYELRPEAIRELRPFPQFEAL